MLKTIALVVLVALLGFAGYVAMQPEEGTITRSATIAAPPSAVFPYINDLHKWQDWSPWAKLDPSAKTSFEGPPAGVGSAFGWSGNSEVGEGKMTIAESKPDELVKMDINFAKPFSSKSVSEFQLKSEGAGTNVTWSMTGKKPFFARAMCIIFNADKQVGSMFEKGLANLNQIVSNAPKP